jgi:hypothetical protein
VGAEDGIEVIHFLVLSGNLFRQFHVAIHPCIPVRNLAAQIPLPYCELTDFIRYFFGVCQKQRFLLSCRFVTTFPQP